MLLGISPELILGGNGCKVPASKVPRDSDTQVKLSRNKKNALGQGSKQIYRSLAGGSGEAVRKAKSRLDIVWVYFGTNGSASSRLPLA